MYIYQIKSTNSKGNVTLVHTCTYTHVFAHIYMHTLRAEKAFISWPCLTGLGLQKDVWFYGLPWVLFWSIYSFVFWGKNLREASYLKFKYLRFMVKHLGIGVRWTLLSQLNSTTYLYDLGPITWPQSTLSIKGAFQKASFKAPRIRWGSVWTHSEVLTWQGNEGKKGLSEAERLRRFFLFTS